MNPVRFTAKLLAWLILILMNLALFLLPLGILLNFNSLSILPTYAQNVFYYGLILIYIPLSLFCMILIVWFDLKVSRTGIDNYIKAMTGIKKG